jgi:hypothetical protein
VKAPKQEQIAAWVAAVRDCPDRGRTGADAARRRVRATRAAVSLAKHNLGINGLPLGKVAP